MSLYTACQVNAPEYLCEHVEVLIYIAPSIALAIMIRLLAKKHPFFFLLTLAGTFCHELAHFVIGLITGARPVAMRIVPRRTGRHWELGSVAFGSLRWYNAAPTALAPIAIIAIPFLVGAWRVQPNWQFETTDIAIAFLLAPQFLSFWPSSTDWRIALRSWPLLLIILSGYWLWHTQS